MVDHLRKLEPLGLSYHNLPIFGSCQRKRKEKLRTRENSREQLVGDLKERPHSTVSSVRDDSRDSGMGITQSIPDDINEMNTPMPIFGSFHRRRRSSTHRRQIVSEHIPHSPPDKLKPLEMILKNVYHSYPGDTCYPDTCMNHDFELRGSRVSCASSTPPEKTFTFEDFEELNKSRDYLFRCVLKGDHGQLSRL